MSETVPSDYLINPPRSEEAGVSYALPETNMEGDRVAAQERLTGFAKFAIPSAIAGTIDSITSGVGLTSTTAVSDFMSKYISSDAGQYYASNRDAAMGVGTLATLPLAGIAATKVIQGGGFLYRMVGAESSPALRGMFTSGMAWGDVAATVRAQDMVLATNGTLDFSRGISAMLRTPASREVLGKVALDSVKNSLAFEAGVFATHHGNQLVYPDDQNLAGYFAINGGFAVGALGIDLLIARKVMANALQSVAREAHGAYDAAATKGLKDVVISRPNERGTDLTTKALDIVVNENAKLDPRIQEPVVPGQLSLRDGLNNLVVQQEMRLMGSLDEAGQDAFKIGQYTIIDKGNIPKGGSATLYRHLTDLRTGSVDSLVGMYGYQSVPADVLAMREKLEAPGKAIAGLQAENFKLTQEYINAVGTQGEAKALAALDKNAADIKAAENTQMFVYEPTGNVINAAHWAPKAFDHPELFTISKVNATEGNAWSLKLKGVGTFQGDKQITLTPGFDIVVPQKPVIDADGKSGSRSLITDFTTANLVNDPDINSTAIFVAGNSEAVTRQIVPTLTAEQSRALSAWKGTSNSELRNWYMSNVPSERAKADAIYNAFEPVREMFRQAGIKYITMYRGTTMAEAKNASESIASFSADPRVAKGFAKDVIIKVNVPIENIVAPVGGLGKSGSVSRPAEGNIKVATANEVEFIVRDPHLIKPGTTILHEAGWGGLNNEEISGAFMLYDHAVSKYVPGKQTVNIDPFNDHWTKLDAVTELLRRKPDAVNDIRFHGQKTTTDLNSILEAVEYSALRGKYAELVEDLEKRQNMLSGPINLRNQVGGLQELAAKYNFPIGAAGDHASIFQTLLDTYTSTGIKTLDGIASNLTEVKAMLATNKTFNELVPTSQREVRTRGNAMNLWRDKEGNVLPSVLVASRPVPYESLSRKWLTEQAEIQRERVFSAMAQASMKGATLVQTVHDSAGVGSGTFRTAQQADTLVQGIETGGGIFSSQRRTMNTNPAYQAADGLGMLIERSAEKEVETIFARHNAPLGKLISEGTDADKFQFGRFAQTQSAGWVFREMPPTQLPNAANSQHNLGFVLDHNSEVTQKLWKTWFPRQSIDDVMAANSGVLWAPDMIAAQRGEYIPLAVNPMAANAALAFHGLGMEALHNKNMIRELAGKAPLNARAYHMPPPDFVNPNTLFVIYPDGRAVIATGRTPAEANVAANKLRDSAPAGQQAFIDIVSKEALRQRSETMDDVFWRMVDPSDPLVASGPNRGGFFMSKVPTGDGFVRSALDSINEEFQSVIYRSRVLLFEPQIKYADLMHGVSGFVDTGKKSVWETYNAKLTGSSPFSPQSTISRVYKGIESGYDAVANKLFGMFVNQESGRSWSRELLAQTDNIKKQSWHDKLYKDLSTSDYNPYGSVVDLIQAEHKITPPKSLAQHAAKFNNAMSLLMLRFMDTGNALINMTSLAANLPSVTRALKRLPGEDAEQWGTRIGWFGSTLNDEVAFLNPARLMTSVTHSMFTPAGKADMDLLKQYNQISSITHEMMKTKFDPAGTLETGNWAKFTRAATYMVDKSEELSRTMAMMAGLRLGRTIDAAANPADLVAFAGRFANDVIADYRPHNRPQIFSGSVGMPLGLFQTYAWNYFERLFGYIADRNIRAIAVQAAMQGSLFGAESLPGFNQFQSLFTDNLNVNSNPVDNIRKRYGELPADFLLYGSLSNIPRLFGAGDGLSLFTRADSNFRGVPSVVTWQQSAAYSLLESIGKTVGAEVAQFRTGGQFSLQQTMEAVGTYFPNRYVKRMAEIWTGYSVDERGQLISDDVRSYMSVAARNMGLRTLKEQREIEGYLRTRSVAQSQAAIRDRASDSLRAIFRSGNVDSDKVLDIARDYIKQGGDPRYVGRFFTNQALAALVERDDRALAEAVRGGKWDAFLRLHGASKED